MKIRDQKNFWSGVMFIAFGAFFVGWAQQYDMGSAARMGPAFFPTMLGGIMFVLGIDRADRRSRDWNIADGKIEPFNFKALVLVLGSVIAFGLLLRPAGLTRCTVRADWRLQLSAAMNSSCAMCCCCRLGCRCWCIAVFIYGLSMTIPVWPAFMRD